MSDGTPVLALEKVSKSFGAVQALQDVDFEVRPGEVVALVGDNGAGKSTLVKAIAGIHSIDDGRILFEGQPVKVSTPTDAVDLGIATVTRQLDETSMERQAHELLDNLAVTITDVRAEVGTMSGGQRQQVAIARSLLGDPKVVMLDEPTAALGVRQTAQVLALIKRLRDNGHGVVVISHNLANVFEVADRIVVLRLGRLAAVYDARQTSNEEVVGAITGASDPSTGDLGPAIDDLMRTAREHDRGPGETPDGEPEERETGGAP